MTETVEQRMTQRATRLAALQILYGQQFHGETIQQVDPLLEEADAGFGEGFFDEGFDGSDGETTKSAKTKSVTKSATKSATKSDRAFLARLLSSARTNKRPLQVWLASASTRRSWQNVDLLLRLVLWLATAEMLLERVGGRGNVVGKVASVGSVLGNIGKVLGLASTSIANGADKKPDSEKQDEKPDNNKPDNNKPDNNKPALQPDSKKEDKQLRRKLGILAGEYCGIASLFYDERGTIGFVNGILDTAASCDLPTIVAEWFAAEQQEKLRITTAAEERVLAQTKAREDKLARELRIKTHNEMIDARDKANSKIDNKIDSPHIANLSYSYGADKKRSDGLEKIITGERGRDDEEW